MKNIYLILVLFSFGVFQACTEHEYSEKKAINASDFGLNESGDALPALQKALVACRNQKASKLIIPEGVYQFYNEKANEKYLAVSNNDNGLKRVGFDLTGFSSLEIDGNGSEFIFHGHIVPFVIHQANDIHLKNFSIDWAKPLHSEGVVTNVNKLRKSFDLKLKDWVEYEIINGELLYNSGGHWQNMQNNLFFDPVTKATVHNVSAYKIAPWDHRNSEFYEARELEKGLIRISALESKLPEEGWVMVIKGRSSRYKSRYSPGIHVFESKGVQFDSINIFHAGGMGIIAERSADISMDHVNVKLREGSNRVVSTTADATHFVNCKGQVSFNHCVFENMLDDATNVHGIYTEFVDLVDDYTIGIRTVHYQQTGFTFAGKGDSIQLVDQPTLMPYGEKLVVEEYELVNESYSKLKFTTKVKGLIQPETAVENVSWYCSVSVKNCEVRQNRARSMLFAVPREIIVENNTFNSMMAGISIGSDANDWY